MLPDNLNLEYSNADCQQNPDILPILLDQVPDFIILVVASKLKGIFLFFVKDMVDSPLHYETKFVPKFPLEIFLKFFKLDTFFSSVGSSEKTKRK